MPKTKATPSTSTDPELWIDESCYRARLRSYPTGLYKIADSRRTPHGWMRIHDLYVPDGCPQRSYDKGDLRHRVEVMVPICTRLYQGAMQQKACDKARRLRWDRQQEEAEQELRDWLDSLPFGADAYKEDPRRWDHGCGPDGERSREMDMYRWLRRKAAEHYPDELRNVKAEIRGKHGLPEGAPLW